MSEWKPLLLEKEETVMLLFSVFLFFFGHILDKLTSLIKST